MKNIVKKLQMIICVLSILVSSMFLGSIQTHAAYYHGRENYLGFGIDAVQAQSISQDSVKTTAAIFNSSFLDSRPHISLPAPTTQYNVSKGFSHTSFMENFNMKVGNYQSIDKKDGLFSYGEAQSLVVNASVDFSEVNSAYYNRTSVTQTVGGYALDECTSNPGLYSGNLRTSFIFELSNLPTTYTQANRNQFIEFFQTFGTHVICKAYYGGKADIYKTVTSNTKNFDNQIQGSLNSYFGGEYNSIVEGSSSSEYSLQSHMGWDSSDFSESTNIDIIGGMDVNVFDDVNLFADIVNAWKSSINWTNAEMVEFGDSSLYPIYKLIYPISSSKSYAMKTAYNSYLQENYNIALDIIKTGTPFMSNNKEVFDGLRTITDDTRWDNPYEKINFSSDLNLNLTELRNLGYTEFDITFTVTMHELYIGYQHFHLYDTESENGAVLLGEKQDIEYGGNSWIPTTKWGEYTFTLSNIPIDDLVNDYVVLRARASGAGRDDWEYSKIVVKVVFS